MNCPNCSVSLVMTDRSGVEIDYCPQCRGVWLDRGELDKIIERSSLPVQSDRMSEKKFYSEGTDPRYKKKKGLLGDLFDF